MMICSIQNTSMTKSFIIFVNIASFFFLFCENSNARQLTILDNRCIIYRPKMTNIKWNPFCFFYCLPLALKMHASLCLLSFPFFSPSFSSEPMKDESEYCFGPAKQYEQCETAFVSFGQSMFFFLLFFSFLHNNNTTQQEMLMNKWHFRCISDFSILPFTNNNQNG